MQEIRDIFTPRIKAELSPDQRTAVEPYLPPDSLHVLQADDLPHTLTAGLRERSGRLDRAVMVFPKPSDAAWHGDALATFTNELRRISGTDARPAGSIPLSADIISSISRDGPLATLAALLGVVLLVTAIFRFNRSTLLIIGSLLVGVLWLTAATLVLKVKVNFCNFIAFPITFGIGVDYAVNVMARYRQTGEKDVIEAIRSTGGAVALCSMTTIIGYGSLLLATNRALFLFGLVAVLGELCCLVTGGRRLASGARELGQASRSQRGRACTSHALAARPLASVASAQPFARGPKRLMLRTRPFSRSTSRSRGGALVTKFATSCRVASAISSTARSNSA